MIGFEYICQLYNVKYSDIARELEISRQTVNSWVSKKRKITQKYIPILSKKFKVPKEYLQKELNDIDKLTIQKIKINHDKSIKTYKNNDIVKEIDSVMQYNKINLIIEFSQLVNKINDKKLSEIQDYIIKLKKCLEEE